MDYTYSYFKYFLISLQKRYSNYCTVEKYINQSIGTENQKVIILRHDVDRRPQNALKIALIERELGVNSTFYFRIVRKSYDLRIMNMISNMGHEIGYHYEDMDLASKKLKGKSKKEDIIDLAYEGFCKNLEMIRENFDVKTICMHGSPLSSYDNKLMWTKYNYRDNGIIGEPYFDINWNEFAYFTDTGRRWNGNGVSIRDKVNTPYKYNYKTTRQIIDNIDKLPDKIMFTIHPERWNDDLLPWIKEMIYQNIKNVFKKVILYKNKIESI